MTIYVDDMLLPAKVAGARSARWSHLMTDQVDKTELHEFAARLGLRRAWFQHEKKYPTAPWRWHYDVTATVRAQALKLGAVSVTYPYGLAEVMDRCKAAARAETVR